MPNQSEAKAKEIKLTPSTRKLIDMRKGKGLGMLTEEERELLRQSSREMWKECINALESISSSGPISDFIGVLSDKTDQTATQQEIESAAANGWAGKASKKDG
jgi:hypothetical protein